MLRLKGKTAVITGGATGIGRAAAKRFIEEGAFVFIFGRRQDALDAAVADLGPNARAVKGSVSMRPTSIASTRPSRPSAEPSTSSSLTPGREARCRSARSPPGTSTRPSTPT